MRNVDIDVATLPPVPARVSVTVQRKIDAGDMYDAQQLVKTFSNSCEKQLGHCHVVRKAGIASASLCLAWLVYPCFAAKGHGALALDLATTALQCMQEQSMTPTEEQLQLVADLLEASTLDPRGGPTAKDISTYVSRAVKWSRKPDAPIGSLRLHRAAAAANWRIKNYGLCQARANLE
ncbi:hypothetical protein Emag_002833 [Eimeria magna]